MDRFASAFATKLEAMLSCRKARGFKEEAHLGSLRRFDRFCTEHYRSQIN